MNKLYLMMGIPGAGKSYWINHHKQLNDKWVSRDEVRLSLVKEDEPYFFKENQVFDQWIQMINDNLQQGFNVYADATHLTEKSRFKTLTHMSKVEWDCIWIKTPIQQAIEWNAKRAGSRRFVPENVIYMMHNRMTPPQFSEGFKTIYIIEPNKPIQIYEEM